jgi:hypothetical protein
MNITKYISYSIVLLIGFACRPEQRLEKVELNAKIELLSAALSGKNTNAKIPVNFCELVPLPWDTILVVGPFNLNQHLHLCI